MKIATSSLIVALMLAGPVLAQNGTAIAPDNPEEIAVVNGVPVNPELRERIMQSPEKRSVQDLIDLSNSVIELQQQDIAAATAAQQGQDAWMSNPFNHLEGEMGEIVQRIDASDTGDTTQERGEEVVQKLDTLIALMEQACSACQSCSSSGGSQPGPVAGAGKPADDSDLRQGPGGSGDLRGDGEGNADIDSLTDAQRDEILLSGQDGFPEGYEALLAEYYARLATESAAPVNNEDQPE